MNGIGNPVLIAVYLLAEIMWTDSLTGWIIK